MVQGLGFRVQDLGLRQARTIWILDIMENQKEKQMEHDMETTIIGVLCVDSLGLRDITPMIEDEQFRLGGFP